MASKLKKKLEVTNKIIYNMGLLKMKITELSLYAYYAIKPWLMNL